MNDRMASWVRPARALLVAGMALYLGACASLPPSRNNSLNAPYPDTGAPLSGMADNQDVVQRALALQGMKYRYGGHTPSTGFDCSGLVAYVYGQTGLKLPRTSYAQAQTLAPIPEENLLPGDLVFFNTNGRAFSHVGIYIGNGQFIHAPSSRNAQVSIANLDSPYWRRHFSGARRAP